MSNFKTQFITRPADLDPENLPAKHLDRFFGLHRECFPVDEEREERSEIEARVRGGLFTPHTYLILVFDENEVVGGAIIEFYPKSVCALLTYIFTDEKMRGRGIGKKLLTDEAHGIPALLKLIENGHGKRINAFFFESENPFHAETPTAALPIHYSERLMFFYKMGAKRINFPYVQPPLGEGKGFARNLYLCLIPGLTGMNSLLPTQTLFCFETEFYHYLREFHPLHKTDPAAFGHDFRLAETWAQPAVFDFRVPELRDFREVVFAGSDPFANEYVNGMLYLHEMPRMEQPKLKFERAAVAFELAVDETYFAPLDESGLKKLEELNRLNHKYCVVTHSFETDLFAYAHQPEPPYFTRCFIPFDVGKYEQEIIIKFPLAYEFVSEGRKETFYQLLKNESGELGTSRDGFYEVRAKAYLNFSFFRRSDIRVWHLVITSKPEPGFSELDIIKLTKFFGGAQESRSEDEKIKLANRARFECARQEMTLYELFEFMSQLKYVAKEDKKEQAKSLGMTMTDAETGRERIFPGLKCLKTGVVQIDTDYCSFTGRDNESTDQAAFQKVLKKLYANRSKTVEGNKVTVSEVQDDYKVTSQVEHVFEAYCGITLGIFDYDRMGYEEVSDTLLPRSATASSFLTINRGVLTSFGYDDSVLRSAWDSIGINPYLLIPSAVLAQNELVSRDAFDRVEDKLAELGRSSNRKTTGLKGVKTINLNELEKLRSEVLELLNNDLMSNVFQYPTEKDLYEYGMTHRGIYERIALTKAKLGEINNLIEEGNAVLNQQYAFRTGFAAMIIAALQSLDVVKSIFPEDNRLEWLVWPVWGLFCIFLSLLTFYWYSQLRQGKDTRYVRK